MAKITVWSKQHENVWKVLQETGRYTVKREYIIKDLKEHSELVLDTYEWLVKNGPDYGNKPADVEFRYGYPSGRMQRCFRKKEE